MISIAWELRRHCTVRMLPSNCDIRSAPIFKYLSLTGSSMLCIQSLKVKHRMKLVGA